MKLILAFMAIFTLMAWSKINAQVDSVLSKIKFETDFRFRVEQDWDSKKSDGTFRNNRTRLRYRLRTGATYKNDWFSFGFRIRTGDPKKQQDPQLTLGKGFEEFGTLPIGFEKVYFKGIYNGFQFWLGKNDFSFYKNNELFWSDNVFPEGAFLEYNFKFKTDLIERIDLRAGHYILSSVGNSLINDAYFQGLQTAITFKNKAVILAPSIYLFRNIPNIPDGADSFTLNYSIFHLSSKFNLLSSKKLLFDFDLYSNVEDYSSNDDIPKDLENQNKGYSLGIQYGNLKKSKEWMLKVTLASMQRFAIVDFMAQNDWARWDYSSYNSPDGRLSNFNGAEIVVGYNINGKINLIAKYYLVQQIVPIGLFHETGQRIRLDLNVKL